MSREQTSEGPDPLLDVELEAEFLGLLLTDNAHVDRAADILSPADLTTPVLRRIYETILHMVGQGETANPATLRPLFLADPDLQSLGGPVYLAQLTANPNVYLSGPQAARQLAGMARRRKLRAGLLEAARQCSVLTQPIRTIVAQADAAMTLRGDDGVRQSTGADCIAELIDGLDRPMTGVLCSRIPSLDRLHGPMEPSQLIIMAARPGMGKTACALSYSIAAAQNGHGVLFISLEMNRQQLAGRMAADLCFGDDAIPYAAIRDRRLSDYQRSRIREALTVMRGLPLNVVDAGTMTPGRLAMLVRSHARRMQAMGQKLELVVVDYLQLMRADSGSLKPYEAVSEVSRGLKAIAKEQDVAVLALAQLSRDVERRDGKRPILSDLRDSGQIEQDADSVILLLRDEYYLQQSEPELMSEKRATWDRAMELSRGRIEFILAKRRNGVTGSAIGHFHGVYQAVR